MARPRDAFESRLSAASTMNDLRHLFEAAIRTFGLSHFAIGELPLPGRDSVIWVTDWPLGWIQRYAVNGYAAEDIGVHEALRSPEPKSWGELKALYPGQAQRIFATAAEFDWHDGFIVPVHGPDDERGIVATMGEALHLSDPESRPALVAIALAAYRRARTLHREPPKGPQLTRREREALHLVAQGLDDAAIGKELGITRTSAHAYVERAKKRLGANTRAQAVALAMAHGLIISEPRPAADEHLCL